MQRHSSRPLLASLSQCLKENGHNARGLATTAPARAAQPPHRRWTPPPRPTKEDANVTKEVSDEPVKPLEVARNILLRQSDGDARGNWEHPTRVLRAEEMRLKNAVVASSAFGAASIEQSKFNALPAQEDDFDTVLDVSPGSFIEVRRNDSAKACILIAKVLDQQRALLVSMTENGELWVHRPTDVAFVLPGCVPETLAQRCGTYLIPEDEKELAARMKVLKELRSIVRTLETRYQIMWASKQHNIYERLRSPNPGEWSETSVAEVINMIENNPKFEGIYATHRYLMDNSIYFVARDPYIHSQVFDIRPKEEVDVIKQVMEWKRQSNGPLQDFAKRAIPVMERIRPHLAKNAKLPPSVVEKIEGVWTENDRVILRFLLSSLRPTRSTQLDPYEIGTLSIIRLLEPKAAEVLPDHVWKTLVDLGVIAPWQDLTVLQKAITSEPEPNPNSPQVTKDRELAEKSLSQRPAPGAPLGPEDFYPTDPLESVRHDFGDLPAFIIDDPSAKELDDAISVERIPNEPGKYWVHAHIANPTAVLPPTHIFARRALKTGTTRYLIHRSIPMFPDSIVMNPDANWSLRTSVNGGAPSRVLTFSAKIDESGNVLDHRVRAGLLSNLRAVSYDAVDEALGLPQFSSLSQQPFGKCLASPLPATKFTQKEKEDLALLHKLAQGCQKRRFDDGVVYKDVWTNQLSFGEFPSGSLTPDGTSRQFQGFPELTKFTVFRASSFEEGARGVVAEVMKLGSRVASRFAQDRQIPFIRRAMQDVAFSVEGNKEKALSLRNPFCGVLDHQFHFLFTAMFPAEYTLYPKAHAAVGALDGEGYSRVTSPLRRAVDLVNHWQLHSALLGDKVPNAQPIFTREWMEDYKNTFTVCERIEKSHDRSHQEFWRCIFLKKWIDGELRGFNGQINPAPETFSGFVVSEPRFSTWGVQTEISIPMLGMSGFIMTPSTPRFIAGEEIKVKIDNITLGLRPRLNLALVN